MHLLPNTLAPLASAADPKEGARWAVTGVRLTLKPDGGWQAVATDTKTLLQATGSAALPADDFPTWKALEDAPNSATEALIPATHWAGTFAAAKKLTGKRRFPVPPRAVAVKLAPNLATFGFTDREAVKTENTTLVEGKFPPVEVIWPKRKPTMTVALDPKRLAALLKTMSALLPDDADCQRVEFDLIDADKPVILRASTPEMELKGLVMPLGERDGSDPKPPAADADLETADTVAAWAKVVENQRAEVERLRAELERLRADLAAERQSNDALRAAQASYAQDVRELTAERDAALGEINALRAAQSAQARNLREALGGRPVEDRPAEVRTSTPPAPTPERKLTRRERLAQQA